MPSLKNQKIAIVTHEYFKGSGQELRDFLITQKIPLIYYVAHLFFYSKVPSISYLEVYKNGKQTKKTQSPVFPKNEFILYIRDAFYNLWFFLTTKQKFDLFVGSNSFNAIFGMILKKLGKVEKTAFLTIDYIMHNRFNQPWLKWLNSVYVKMDRIAFFGSDYTLNVSERMARQRITELGDKAKEKVQITVPIGIMTEAQNLKVDRKDNILVYSGNLGPEFGLERMLEAMPQLIKEFPNLEFRIIGDGVLREKLEKMVKELKIDRSVNFMGYIDTSKERERWLRLLKESTLGIATYEETDTTYKKFSDVTKPKDYMSCDLPIITTSVIPLSEDVKKYNLGRVVEDNVASLAKNISELLRDEKERKQIEQNVYNFCKEMTWDNIFIRMFEQMDVTIN